MEVKVRTRLGFAAFLATILALTIAARPKGEQEDNLVRLMKAESLEQIEINGQQYRKAIASTFLHNGTYLISDTALWNVSTKVINCRGHVKVIQDETILTSEKLDYYIDQNLAQFSGTLVQLQNKKRNILRTKYLDYNTKDSIATFRNGGAMRDQNGQIIESRIGNYFSRDKYFLFQEEVNMFTDSVFVSTNSLYYRSEQERAEFPSSITFWKGPNVLTAMHGWYNRADETFFFRDKVHGISEDQEVWTDTVYFNRITSDVLMMGNVQIQDSVRDVATLSNRAHYQDSIRQVDLWNNAAVALFTENDGKRDTIYIGGDSLRYRHVRYCDIPEGRVKQSETRLRDILADAVTEYRVKAAQQAAEEAAKMSKVSDAAKARKEKKEAEKSRPPGQQQNVPEPQQNIPQPQQETPEPQESAPQPQDFTPDPPASLPAPPDSITAPLDSVLASIDSLAASVKPAADSAQTLLPLKDSLEMSKLPADSTLTHAPDSLSAAADSALAPLDSLAAPADSLAAQADSLMAPPPDTTRYGFAWAMGNVKIFRRDLQVRCDSMYYNDLDSIACFYKDPVVWNEGNRQYTSDSLFVLVGGGGARKASLQGNAFVITQDDEVCFDQIKGAEIMAWFDSTKNTLRRFDALGGASALFYLQENGALATVNKVESKMLSGLLLDGTIDKVYYFDSPKNNAYPVVQLPPDESKMKGFTWRPDERPSKPSDITGLKLNKPQRKALRSRKRPQFKQAAIYFPGYIDGIRKEIALRDSLAKLPRPAKKKPIEDAEPQTDTLLARADSLAANIDSLVREINTVTDSLKTVIPDTLAVSSPQDSTAAAVLSGPADSTATVSAPQDPLAVPTVDPKQKKKEERELRRQMRIARRNARIAEREKRWAQLDSLDAAKAAAKQQKALEKERAKKLRQLKLIRKREEREAAKLQKYIEKYRKQYEREQKSQPAGERSPAAETGGEVPAAPGPGEKAPRGDAVLRDDGPADDGPVLSRGSLPGA